MFIFNLKHWFWFSIPNGRKFERSMKLLCFIRQIAFFSCFFSIFSIQVIWLAVLTITLQQEFPLVIVIYPEIFAIVHSVVKILKYIEGLHLRTNSIKNVLLINYFLFYHLHNWYLLNSKNMSLAVLCKAECKRRFVWLRSHNWMYETMTKFRQITPGLWSWAKLHGCRANQ